VKHFDEIVGSPVLWYGHSYQRLAAVRYPIRADEPEWT